MNKISPAHIKIRIRNVTINIKYTIKSFMCLCDCTQYFMSWDTLSILEMWLKKAKRERGNPIATANNNDKDFNHSKLLHFNANAMTIVMNVYLSTSRYIKLLPAWLTDRLFDCFSDHFTQSISRINKYKIDQQQ